MRDEKLWVQVPIFNEVEEKKFSIFQALLFIDGAIGAFILHPSSFPVTTDY